MIRLSFDQIVNEKNPVKFIISPNCKNSIVCLYSNLRIKRDTVPEGWYLYEIRGCDDGTGDFATIEDHVLVNFEGSLLTEKPIKYRGGKTYFNLCNRYGYAFA